ncbi:hypothetical protein HK098_007341, partial [Nowakowskiella sp. JEL0407]
MMQEASRPDFLPMAPYAIANTLNNRKGRFVAESASVCGFRERKVGDGLYTPDVLGNELV